MTINVSVIIPAYNSENYISECLSCVTNQTLREIEIICVDDGSTDGTKSIIEELKKEDDRISLICQSNKGAGAARNNGMKRATGEYLYFFDSDDCCDKRLLEKAYNNAKHNNSDIVVFDYCMKDDVNRVTTHRDGLNRALLPIGRKVFSYKDYPDEAFSMIIPTPWNKLFRKEFVEKSGIEFLEITSTNDITFCALTSIMAKRISYIDEELMCYRTNVGKSITSQKQKKLDNVLKAVDGVIEGCNNIEINDNLDKALAFFAISNYLVALERYAGDFKSKYYRRYWGQLHRIFRNQLFENVDQSVIGSKRYKQFNQIKKHNYVIVALSKIKRRIMKDNNKLIEKELREQRKLITRIKEDVYELTAITTEIKQRTINIEMNSNDSLKACLSNKKRDKEIIVSMTSYPARIIYAPDTIETIFRQTVKPDRIIIWLAEEQFPNKEMDLPCRLLEMKARGLEIRWCEDIKSYKKIVPTLKQFGESIIILVDDDILYDVSMIEVLLMNHQKNPQSIIASRVHKIEFNDDGRVKPYREWKKEISSKEKINSKFMFFTTGGGTLIPPHTFSGEDFNVSQIMECCPFADDLWINVLAKIKNIDIVNTGYNRTVVNITNAQDSTLYNDINKRENDKQLTNIINLYKEKLKAIYS